MLFSIFTNHLGTRDKSSNEISWKTKLGGTLKGKDWNFKHEGDEDWNNKELDLKVLNHGKEFTRLIRD